MKQIEINGLKFNVINHSDLTEMDRLYLLAFVYCLNDFEFLTENYTFYPKSYFRNTLCLKQFLTQLPIEKQHLLQERLGLLPVVGP